MTQKEAIAEFKEFKKEILEIDKIYDTIMNPEKTEWMKLHTLDYALNKVDNLKSKEYSDDFKNERDSAFAVLDEKALNIASQCSRLQPSKCYVRWNEKDDLPAINKSSDMKLNIYVNGHSHEICLNPQCLVLEETKKTLWNYVKEKYEDKRKQQDSSYVYSTYYLCPDEKEKENRLMEVFTTYLHDYMSEEEEAEIRTFIKERIPLKGWHREAVLDQLYWKRELIDIIGKKDVNYLSEEIKQSWILTKEDRNYCVNIFMKDEDYAKALYFYSFIDAPDQEKNEFIRKTEEFLRTAETEKVVHFLNTYRNGLIINDETLEKKLLKITRTEYKKDSRPWNRLYCLTGRDDYLNAYFANEYIPSEVKKATRTEWERDVLARFTFSFWKDAKTMFDFGPKEKREMVVKKFVETLKSQCSKEVVEVFFANKEKSQFNSYVKKYKNWASTLEKYNYKKIQADLDNCLHDLKTDPAHVFECFGQYKTAEGTNFEYGEKVDGYREKVVSWIINKDVARATKEEYDMVKIISKQKELDSPYFLGDKDDVIEFAKDKNTFTVSMKRLSEMENFEGKFKGLMAIAKSSSLYINEQIQSQGTKVPETLESLIKNKEGEIDNSKIEENIFEIRDLLHSDSLRSVWNEDLSEKVIDSSIDFDNKVLLLNDLQIPDNANVQARALTPKQEKRLLFNQPIENELEYINSRRWISQEVNDDIQKDLLYAFGRNLLGRPLQDERLDTIVNLYEGEPSVTLNRHEADKLEEYIDRKLRSDEPVDRLSSFLSKLDYEDNALPTRKETVYKVCNRDFDNLSENAKNLSLEKINEFAKRVDDFENPDISYSFARDVLDLIKDKNQDLLNEISKNTASQNQTMFWTKFEEAKNDEENKDKVNSISLRLNSEKCKEALMQINADMNFLNGALKEIINSNTLREKLEQQQNEPSQER